MTETGLDAVRCAELAGLRYVSDAEPGIRRVRRGKGFSYLDARNRPVAATERARLAALAVPPAWQNVWLCADDSGHLLATGIDQRGRKQYLYHQRWREFRDELNFGRLIRISECLPRIRRNVTAQLRRPELDLDRILAAMVRVIDTTGIRIGNEVYAEENESFGLTTLTRRHIRVDGTRVTMCFPAKSGKRAQLELDDVDVSRVLSELIARRSRRLFTIDRHVIDSDAVNTVLSEWSGGCMTAKDFRTWHGTRVAYETLERTAPHENAEAARVAAADAASTWLNNTRAVARSSYIHPAVLAAAGTDWPKAITPRSPGGLTAPERRLRQFLLEVAVEVPALAS
jgi:DNA topoisomerase-1